MVSSLGGMWWLWLIRQEYFFMCISLPVASTAIIQFVKQEAIGVWKNISWKFIKAWPQHLPLRPTSSSLFLNLSKREIYGGPVDGQPPRSQNLFQQQADTLWEIKHGGILSRWNHCIPPTLFPCTAGERKRHREKEEKFSDGLFGSDGAWLISRPRNSAGRWTGTCHLECEAAGVILRDTVRWSGWPCLRSAQLLLPLIFNRCLGARPAKSSHMPEQGNQSKDPAAGWAPRLTHTAEGAHTQTALCVLNHCH